MSLFMLETSAVDSASSNIGKIASRVSELSSSVSGYDVSCDGGFEFGSAKNAIVSNLDACLTKMNNTAGILNAVSQAHTQLQNSLKFSGNSTKTDGSKKSSSSGGSSGSGGGSSSSSGGSGGSSSSGGGSSSGSKNSSSGSKKGSSSSGGKSSSSNQGIIDSIKDEVGNTIGDYSGFNDGEWCADFVSHTLQKNGYNVKWSSIAGHIDDNTIFRVLEDSGATIHLDQAAQYNGESYDSDYTPQAGDVVLFDFAYGSTPDGTTDHVGFVVKDNGDGTITTIEGNTTANDGSSGSCVEMKVRNRSEVYGYATPVK